MLSALLPRRFYTYGDDRLYSLYQRLILYFFNTYTAVDVRHFLFAVTIQTAACHISGCWPRELVCRMEHYDRGDRDEGGAGAGDGSKRKRGREI